MKKYALSFFMVAMLVVTLSIVASVVIAAGGGGGGGGGSCSDDQWDCTGWSQCSPEEKQTRVCTLSFDCPSVAIPKPQETQSCTLPTPQVPPTPQTSTPTPSPIPSQPQQSLPLTCTKDTWTCNNWSTTCDSNGRERRVCTLTNDCKITQTPPPPNSQACQKLQCANKATLRERILCRLNLSPAGVVRELKIQYLPEACKAETGKERQECINIYKAFQPCWYKPQGQERFTCAQNALKLGSSISEQVEACQGKTGNEQAECKHEVQDKILYIISFRFYDLETRAEALAERGANLEVIADFDTVVELKKQEIYKAQTNAERRQIILDVRKAWQEFVNKVKNQII